MTTHGPHEPVAPSFFQLPQRCSTDRLRARRATIAAARDALPLFRDTPDDDLPALPAHWPKTVPLARELDFPGARKMQLALGKGRMKLNSQVVSFTGRGAARYERLYRLMDGPGDVVVRWRDDSEFARQRLAGVNPMSLRRCDERGPADLAAAADTVLRGWGRGAPSWDDLVRTGRAFCTDYEVLLHPDVQRHLKRDGRSLMHAPRVLFGLDTLDRLRPLAIAVRTPDGRCPIATADGPPGRWLVARGHAQSADAQVHEAYYHLFETHLVSETLALCLFRNVYPEHPIRQLLDPHYRYNLAIDCVARGNLLKLGGPIDVAMPGGVVGAMAAARATAKTFDLRERTLARDLELRGVTEVPDYPYRDDARRVRDGLARYVRGVLSPWYRSDQDVVQDTELRAWLEEVHERGGVAGCPRVADAPGGEDGVAGALPTRIGTPAQLFEVLTDFIFRAAPQHAAVNNGQYDTYGFIPNAPGTYARDLPDADALGEDAYWEGLPPRAPSVAQLGMVWVLSDRTHRSLLRAGESPAFEPDVCREANEAVAAFRRRMHELSDAIARRNAGRAVPYRYLDPRNISLSTDI